MAVSDPVDAHLESAVCFAREGDRDAAFEQLQESVDAGLVNRRLLEGEEELHPLHDDPRWAKLLDALEHARKTYLTQVNAELYLLYEQDQAERDETPASWESVKENDRRRLERVQEILASGCVETADDHYHAAMILQHGGTTEDYRLAERLAERASELDPSLENARWLAAAAHDRALWSVGKPQVYGTQFQQDANGRWTQEPFDRDAVSDEMRQERGIPTVEELTELVARMNEIGLQEAVEEKESQ